MIYENGTVTQWMVRGRNWSGGPDVVRHKWSPWAINGPHVRRAISGPQRALAVGAASIV